jgi:diguanylate cyclase (GGDEF)-like protein
MNTYHSLAKIVTFLAGIISLIVFVAIPVGYFSVAYSYESEALQTEANHSANSISEIIDANPQSWYLNERRLVIALIVNSSLTSPHHNRITDAQGKNIAFISVDLDQPIFSRRAELTDGSNVVGNIEVAQSLRPLLVNTGITTLVSAVLALAIYFVLRILPLRALTRVVKNLDESQELLRAEMQAKEQALLEAQSIGSAMRHQAMHDGLTNLPNRILLHDRLQQAILIGLREKKMLALIMMDLDQFKAINDTHGHHTGDIVLQQVATRLLQVLRGSDTVARLGGDEFAILLTAVSGKAGVVIAAQKIMEAIHQTLKIDGRVLHVGTSLGIAIFPEHGDDPEKLLRCADVAMYCAKRAKGGYAIYDVEQDQQNTKHNFLRNDLKAAIEENQFVLHYQPKIDLASNRVCGVEALIRWQHPTEGLIFPDAFIPVAEQNGLVKPLTRIVLKMALQQLTEWKQQGLALPIAINISAINLQDSSFPDQVAEIMRNYTVSPAFLEMEITEAALMQDPLRAIETVNKLCAIGIVISIDDFGTGYSSMAYLKKLVVAKIKVDKSFVIDMIKNENDNIIVRSTIDLAHNLGLTVVAEGVESEEALERLRSLGCDTAQGYHMSRPVPIDELNEWLKKSNWSLDKVKI